MSAANDCNCACPTPEFVAIPGTQGNAGAAGTNGTDGTPAFTYSVGVSAPDTFNKAATGILVNVVDGSMFSEGMPVVIQGAGDSGDIGGATPGYFTVTAAAANLLTLTYLNVAQNMNGSGVANGMLITIGNPTPAVGTLPNALTDAASGGTAGDIIAAGVGISELVIPATLITGGTGAANIVDAITPGFNFKILQWSYVTAVAGVTGVGRVFNMQITGVGVSTVLSTITLAAANTTTLGSKVDGLAISGDNTGAPAATFSIVVANGGTAFTLGSGFFVVRIQNMDTADAIKSISTDINTLITALT